MPGRCSAPYALPTWIAIVALPIRATRWAAARLALRLTAPLLGIRLVVQGLEHLPRNQRIVLVSNRASYVDPMDVRMIEMSLPVDRLDRLRARVQEFGPIAVDAFAAHNGRRANLRLMVPKAQVEYFINQFESLAERYEDFRNAAAPAAGGGPVGRCRALAGRRPALRHQHRRGEPGRRDRVPGPGHHPAPMVGKKPGPAFSDGVHGVLDRRAASSPGTRL